MKRIHPSASFLVVFAALVATANFVGCQNPSGGGVTNPFLAPNRVPPPATRAIMPGQAQPYYPGDPLPVMQSNAAPQTDENGLAWSAPAGGESSTASAASASPPILASNSPVSIPADNASLRFALPAAAPPAAPIVAQAPAAISTQTPIQQAVNPPSTTHESVSQVSYTEPVIESGAPPVYPWRSPQIAQAALPLPPPPLFYAQPPTTVPTVNQHAHNAAAVAPPMAVRMRAIASPTPQPSHSSAPRIRLPGEHGVQSANKDGFRPRSSMR